MILLRAFLILLLLGGAALALGYPFYVERVTAREFAIYRVYDAPGGFRSVTPTMPRGAASVELLVEMVTDGQPRLDGAAALTLTAAAAGKTLLASPLTFEGVEPRMASPQAFERIYRQSAGAIAADAGQAVTVTVAPGDATDLPLRQVDLILRGQPAIDARAQPVGFSVMALAFVALVLSFRHSPPANPNSSPPPPRWGRAGG